jgi:general secretion pathway protein K
MWGRRERGYAMIAAVAAVAVFGYLALAAISGGRSAVVGTNAGLTRARLTADADAGVALAIHGLGLSDPARRWSVTGPPRKVEFEGANLTISVEDENGKIPLNFVAADQLRRLFQLGGADPRTLDGLVEALTDLRGDPRPAGSRAGASPTDPRLAAERGPLSSVEELELLPGMTPALYARIAPAVTVHATTLAFDPRTASPLALEVMSPAAANSPATIERASTQAGETPALAGTPPVALAGRTVTVRVDAEDGHGGRLRRTAIVEFTAAPARPFLVRGLD